MTFNVKKYKSYLLSKTKTSKVHWETTNQNRVVHPLKYLFIANVTFQIWQDHFGKYIKVQSVMKGSRRTMLPGKPCNIPHRLLLSSAISLCKKIKFCCFFCLFFILKSVWKLITETQIYILKTRNSIEICTFLRIANTISVEKTENSENWHIRFHICASI